MFCRYARPVPRKHVRSTHAILICTQKASGSVNWQQPDAWHLQRSVPGAAMSRHAWRTRLRSAQPVFMRSKNCYGEFSSPGPRLRLVGIPVPVHDAHLRVSFALFRICAIAESPARFDKHRLREFMSLHVEHLCRPESVQFAINACCSKREEHLFCRPLPNGAEAAFHRRS